MRDKTYLYSTTESNIRNVGGKLFSYDPSISALINNPNLEYMLGVGENKKPLTHFLYLNQQNKDDQFKKLIDEANEVVDKQANEFLMKSSAQRGFGKLERIEEEDELGIVPKIPSPTKNPPYSPEKLQYLASIHRNLYDIMAEPFLIMERIRDTTQPSNVGYTNTLVNVLTELYKDDLCQPRKNTQLALKSTHIKSLLAKIGYEKDIEQQ